MSKKLVKTAKQQFEERLRELNLVEEWQLCKTEIYYLCKDDTAHVYLLRDQDGEYKELGYGMQYEALVFSERFLSMMSERFAENNVKVKPLFDWYASADHDDEPFNLLDIFMCNLEESHFTFEDLYEEVPEVRIITAKEQWEKDSANAKLAEQVKEDIYKVEVTESAIIFYIFKYNQYCKQWFPPLSELRKDAKFVTDYIHYVHSTHDTDMEAALEWLAGREYTMSEETLLDIYNIASCTEAIVYKDKSINEVAKQDFKKEMDALRNKMVAHIEQLCEQGMTVNVDSFLQNIYSITWVGGSRYACANIKDVYFRKKDEGKWEFSYESKSDVQGDSSDCFLDELTIETLQDIIASMQ